jgi:hypothetical protein
LSLSWRRYACLGKLLGSVKFAFYLLTRTHGYSTADIDERVAAANTMTKGLLDLTAMRLNNASTYETCGM